MKLAPGRVHEAANEVLELWRTRDVRPIVGATFPLDHAPDAHRLIEDRRHIGKVVLVP
jgi:NADPH:quinone reductase-like Zn-dependent oxidoreductase